MNYSSDVLHKSFPRNKLRTNQTLKFAVSLSEIRINSLERQEFVPVVSVYSTLLQPCVFSDKYLLMRVHFATSLVVDAIQSDEREQRTLKFSVNHHLACGRRGFNNFTRNNSKV